MFVAELVAPFDIRLVPEVVRNTERLERALAATCGLLATIVERLDSRSGVDVAGPELTALAAGWYDTATEELVARIDALVKSGDHTPAVRVYRDALGVAWDEAHFAIEHWSAYASEMKLRRIRLLRWIRALEAVHSGSHSYGGP